MIKSLRILGLALSFCALIFVACEEDNCEVCSDCLLADDNGTYCESDFDDVTGFNAAIMSLETGGCTCQ